MYGMLFEHRIYSTAVVDLISCMENKQISYLSVEWYKLIRFFKKMARIANPTFDIVCYVFYHLCLFRSRILHCSERCNKSQSCMSHSRSEMRKGVHVLSLFSLFIQQGTRTFSPIYRSDSRSHMVVAFFFCYALLPQSPSKVIVLIHRKFPLNGAKTFNDLTLQPVLPH